MMGRRARRVVAGAAVLAAVLAGAGSSAGATGSVELVVSVLSNSTIFRVDASTGTVGPAIPVGQWPNAVAITPNGRMAYTAVGYSDAVVPVDLEASTAGAAIPVTCPTQIAIVPGRQKAYVTQSCGTTVTPLDLFTNAAGTPIEVGERPWGVAVTPDGETAYVTTGTGVLGSTNSLVPIDVDTDTPGSAIPLGQEGDPTSAVVTPDGATAFVAMERDDAVIPVDLVAGTAGTPIAVSTNPIGLALTPDGTELFVTHYQRGPSGLGEPVPADVTPIDVATRTALADIAVGSQTVDVAVTADGTTAYVSVLADTDTDAAIVPIDIATGTVGPPILIPGEPFALAIRPQPSGDTTPPAVSLETTPESPTGDGGTWFNAEDLAAGSLTVTALASDVPNVLGGGVTEVRCVVDGVIHAAAGNELVMPVLGDGVHSVSCTAEDSAGNVTDPAVEATYRVDTTAPTLTPTVTGSGPGGAVLLNDPAAVAHPNADDGTGSGVESASCDTPDVSTAGPHTIACSATDAAGNSSTVQATYVVEYALTLLEPADGTSARAGHPLKVSASLADANRAPASLCDGCTVELQTFAVGGSGQDDGPFPMRYHNGSGAFRYAWKPSSSGLGTTRVTVSVHYPGTAVATTAGVLVTVT